MATALAAASLLTFTASSAKELTRSVDEVGGRIAELGLLIEGSSDIFGQPLQGRAEVSKTASLRRPSLLETGAVGRVHGYKRGGYRGTNEVTPTPCLHDALPYPQQVSIHVHVGHCTITFYRKYGSSS